MADESELDGLVDVTPEEIAAARAAVGPTPTMDVTPPEELDDLTEPLDWDKRFAEAKVRGEQKKAEKEAKEKERAEWEAPPYSNVVYQGRGGKWENREAVYLAFRAVGKEAKDRMMEGLHSCPLCQGNNYLAQFCYKAKDGKEQVCYGGEMKCPCVGYRNLRRAVEFRIPRSLQGFSFNNLQPSPKSRLSPDQQEAEIAFLKAHPYDSYLFCGPPGTSKSVYATCLFRNVMAQRSSDRLTNEWYVDFGRFCDIETEYSTAQDKSDIQRIVTAEEIEKRTRKDRKAPVMVLEELDKHKISEFISGKLFSIIRTMDDCEGQMIVTSNRTLEGLTEVFSKSPFEQVRVTGEAIMRRIADPKRVHIRDYFQALNA